ncbi:MAG: phenylalanine--tRNA ligase subunit alpha [Treponema sp.]|nr:phenylalanine--tRNA ligase subunit alpha [Treponema sp.]
MNIESTIKNLHPLEVRILLAYKKGDELTVEKVEREQGFKSGNGNQALSWLLGKGLLCELRRETAVFYELTGLGEEWKEKGSPEERILELIRNRFKSDERPRLPELAEILKMENKDIGSAFGNLSKLGVLSLDGEKKVSITLPLEHLDDPAKNPVLAHFMLIKGIFRKLIGSESGLLAEDSLDEKEKELIRGIAKKRGASNAAFRQIEKETVVFGFTESAETSIKALKEAGISGEEIGSLSPAMLESGSWKGKTFRSYNVKVPPTRLLPGRANPYANFIEKIKDKLASLGFEELDGPLVETEFWNSDALFMPQFHSARDIHDAYRIHGSKGDSIAQTAAIEEPWFSNVKAAHENGGNTGSSGWDYKFSEGFTRQLILRSHGTVLSAKGLTGAKIPGKYFAIVRCFRYDQVDATHLPDFYQTDGIILGEDVNLRTLLGMLELFAVEVAGAKEVKYVPAYFPFTEPSVEVHIKHPVLGWFEMGGSGIFRPEVTESLGIDVPVAAWGLGIDRMAMMTLGIRDIRELFSFDIENVRLRRTRAG